MKDDSKLFSGREFITGTIAGISGGIAGYPLDTIRVRMQVASAADHATKHSSSFRSFKTIMASESASYKTFFRGAAAPAVGVVLQNALLFGITANLQRCFSVRNDDPPSHAKYGAIFAAGTVSGAINCVVASPVDLIKIQMQVHPERAFQNSWDCVRRIVRTSGIRNGLLSGYWPTMIRDAHSYGFYFASYQMSMDLLQTTKLDSHISSFISGGIAGMLCWITSYPMDIIKSRMQGQDILLPLQKREFPSMMSCWTHTIRHDGWMCLWRGLNIALARAFIVNGVTFAVYHSGNQMFDSLKS
ncbi:mitochondrial solute carrier family 25 (mitochondrial carnitine/acylcarnitine transporter) member 20/29 [Andalucia godoyi]|uniref:Mitochondrial solute carrier family 25 (Mitochondrial carnitine/acylcarnitine transporter) member 20/29 n=1 Tax=Andalucia godoyi TaxID=505711 RepID=A0A8K0AG21_ANDGO|nr:mitochondrial solute carrier family 25 (mitochondrial carnitine/acylcarnitine transporter) member 20/29 [Andalucia godoyi]|eukprot:ANDGO_07901.mRNA.1 mitochondrial solute carrier family 25 (mitochondrial carnitine/acylcarnitine transporter) member 20/29